jgi:hypothetical protein
MCKAGMNIARINFSHGTHPEHKQKIESIVRVRERLNLPIAIMLDTKGPEYRIKTFKDGKITLKDGDPFILTTEDVEGDETRVSVTYKKLTEELEPGDQVQASFTYDFYSPVEMKVERISPAEEGRCILVLSSEAYIQNAVSSRAQTADLVFADRSGLRVPKTAIYVGENGGSGVYVLEGAEARWKSIEIIYDNGDSFIVALDKSSTKNLWPEDEIILTTGEIFNGKVMIQ